jgi:beta-lactam-binding protein with PASTA domain
MLLNRILWLLPFICFIAGYQLLNFLFTVESFPTPHLVGLPLDQAVKLVAQKNLNLRIITEKPDQDLPNHTVISQSPTSHTIRPNQTMYVVISQKPAAKVAPKLIGETSDQINQIASNQNLQIKTYHLPNSQTKETCFAQTPADKQPLNNSKMTAYLSSGPNNLVVMPNFIGLNKLTVVNFLKEYHIDPRVITACQPSVQDQTIIDQRPAAGAIIDLAKLTQVQLCINSVD